MQHKPFYDPKQSYEDNYKKGPFGLFATKGKVKSKGEPTYDFFGHKVHLPFGIPAGPILNSKFAKAAFEKGYDLVVYKTVRSDTFPCHPWPNVLPVDVKGNLTLKKATHPLKTKKKYDTPLSITNSFGVPSRDPKVWQKDVKKAISYAGPGQLLILSFMGTVKPNQTEKDFIEDFAKAAKLAKETGAKVLEVNLSCPNIGNEGLVCYNTALSDKVLKRIREVIGKIPLIVKIGYFEKDEDLLKIAKSVEKYAQAIAGINTIAAPIIDAKGKQALPGEKRLRSGVCGDSIRWAGIETVKRLVALKKKHKFHFKITGVGGVMNSDDYCEYRHAGADDVMSATGAMWNPALAKDIKKIHGVL